MSRGGNGPRGGEDPPPRPGRSQRAVRGHAAKRHRVELLEPEPRRFRAGQRTTRAATGHEALDLGGRRSPSIVVGGRAGRHAVRERHLQVAALEQAVDQPGGERVARRRGRGSRAAVGPAWKASRSWHTAPSRSGSRCRLVVDSQVQVVIDHLLASSSSAPGSSCRRSSSMPFGTESPSASEVLLLPQRVSVSTSAFLPRRPTHHPDPGRQPSSVKPTIVHAAPRPASPPQPTGVVPKSTEHTPAVEPASAVDPEDPLPSRRRAGGLRRRGRGRSARPREREPAGGG